MIYEIKYTLNGTVYLHAIGRITEELDNGAVKLTPIKVFTDSRNNANIWVTYKSLLKDGIRLHQQSKEHTIETKCYNKIDNPEYYL